MSEWRIEDSDDKFGYISNETERRRVKQNVIYLVQHLQIWYPQKYQGNKISPHRWYICIRKPRVPTCHNRANHSSTFPTTGTDPFRRYDSPASDTWPGWINKSVNFKFQRQCFSFHKGRPLVKTMVIVSTTDYFISIILPYFAKYNDASILNHIMKSNIEDIRSWIQNDDVFIVDRGFRDSITYYKT